MILHGTFKSNNHLCINDYCFWKLHAESFVTCIWNNPMKIHIATPITAELELNMQHPISTYVEILYCLSLKYSIGVCAFYCNSIKEWEGSISKEILKGNSTLSTLVCFTFSIGLSWVQTQLPENKTRHNQCLLKVALKFETGITLLTITQTMNIHETTDICCWILVTSLIITWSSINDNNGRFKHRPKKTEPRKDNPYLILTGRLWSFYFTWENFYMKKLPVLNENSVA